MNVNILINCFKCFLKIITIKVNFIFIYLLKIVTLKVDFIIGFKLFCVFLYLLGKFIYLVKSNIFNCIIMDKK